MSVAGLELPTEVLSGSQQSEPFVSVLEGRAEVGLDLLADLDGDRTLEDHIAPLDPVLQLRDVGFGDLARATATRQHGLDVGAIRPQTFELIPEVDGCMAGRRPRQERVELFVTHLERRTGIGLGCAGGVRDSGHRRGAISPSRPEQPTHGATVAVGPRAPPCAVGRSTPDKARAVGSVPAMLRYAVDELNSDRVLGWAFDPDVAPDVVILVDGEPVGRANLGSFRIDVAQSLGDDRATQCGFEFRFQPDHFRRVSGRQARIAVRVGNEESSRS